MQAYKTQDSYNKDYNEAKQYITFLTNHGKIKWSAENVVALSEALLFLTEKSPVVSNLSSMMEDCPKIITTTWNHSLRVAAMSKEIAVRMNKTASEQQTVFLAGLVHDIGKIHIPREVLYKRGKFSPEEKAIIDTHSLETERILNEVFQSVPDEVMQCAKFHHIGIGDGIHSRHIPFSPGTDYHKNDELANIVCCADQYDAMLSGERSYKQPFDIMKAHNIIRDDQLVMPQVLKVADSLIMDMKSKGMEDQYGRMNVREFAAEVQDTLDTDPEKLIEQLEKKMDVQRDDRPVVRYKSNRLEDMLNAVSVKDPLKALSKNVQALGAEENPAHWQSYGDFALSL